MLGLLAHMTLSYNCNLYSFVVHLVECICVAWALDAEFSLLFRTHLSIAVQCVFFYKYIVYCLLTALFKL